MPKDGLTTLHGWLLFPIAHFKRSRGLSGIPDFYITPAVNCGVSGWLIFKKRMFLNNNLPAKELVVNVARAAICCLPVPG
jgi:hypothetical protein